MTLIPEVHDALSRAVAARARPQRRRHPSRRAGLLALAATIATGTALAATGTWHPILGDRHRRHPQDAHTRIPGDPTAAIGVLRRAQTAPDRGPQVRAILRLLPRGEINGVHTDGIRLLRRRADGVTILVPTERVGRHDKGHPSTIRRRVLCVLTGVRTPPHTALGRGRAPKAVRIPGGLSAGASCGDLEQLRTTGIGLATGSPSGFIVSGLVPDRVARVVIRLRGHRTVTARVRDNLYELRTGRQVPPGWGVRWLDARGQVIEHRRGHR